MKLFEIKPYAAERIRTDVTHIWGLPGVKCGVCGRTWANTGLAYPSIDLSNYSDEASLRSPRVVSVEKFKDIKEELHGFIKGDVPLLPGTEFGNLSGTIAAAGNSFEWVNPWTLLVREDVLELLIQKKLKMPKAVPGQLSTSPQTKAKWMELEIQPLVSTNAEKSGVPDLCSVCGYSGVNRPEPLLVRRASIPSDVDLFRAMDLTTAIFVSERFAEIIMNVENSSVLVREVGLVQT